MFSSVLLALLVAAQPQAPTTPPPATGQPRPPAATTPARRPAAGGTTLQIKVTDRSGVPAADVAVSAEGPVSREAVTDASGIALFRTMSAGTYRVRAGGDKFVTFEKEVVVRTTPATTEMALSAAPPPPEPVAAPAPPPPAPAPVAVTGPAGEPKALSIPDMAERSLSGRDPVRTFPIGCSGMSRTQLIVLRESTPASALPETEEMLYLVAGEASIKMGAKEQPLTPGWFAIVPRGHRAGSVAARTEPRHLSVDDRGPALLGGRLGGAALETGT